jgi:predicted PurR-regulated permease PerM
VTHESDLYRLLKPFVVLATVILAVAALYWARMVFIPLALAVLFAFILATPVSWLRRKGVPRWPAALLVTGLAILLVAGACSIVTLELRDLIVKLPQHSKTIGDKIAALNQGSNGFFKPVVSSLQEVYDVVQRNLNGERPASQQPGDGQSHSPKPGNEAPAPPVGNEGQPPPAKPGADVPAVRVQGGEWDTALSIAQPLLEAVVSIILIIVLVIFMLVSQEDLQYRVIRLVGHGHLTSTTQALDEAAERTSKWLLTATVINASFGLVLAGGLHLIPVEGWWGGLPPNVPHHVPYAFLWGFLAMLLRFIPYVGTWFALLFPLTLSIAVFPGWGPPLEVLGFYLVLELVVANFIEPLVFGHTVGISPIALLVAAAFWTWLWGGIGLFMATPLTVCLSVLGRHIPELSFLHVVLGSEPVLDLPNRFYQRLLAHDHDEATDMVEEAVKNQPVESIFDGVLIPALVMLRRDMQHGEMNAEVRENSLRTIAEIVEDLAPRLQPAEPRPANGAEAKAKVGVLACSTGDQTEELALQMFRALVEAEGYSVTVASRDKLSGEIVTMAEADKPSVVCIASLPPGGVSRASYLCKRLRAKLPELQILVGRWGQGDFVTARQRLQGAGANEVANSLVENRKQLLPFLQHRSVQVETAEVREELEHAATH